MADSSWYALTGYLVRTSAAAGYPGSCVAVGQAAGQNSPTDVSWLGSFGHEAYSSYWIVIGRLKLLDGFGRKMIDEASLGRFAPSSGWDDPFAEAHPDLVLRVPFRGYPAPCSFHRDRVAPFPARLMVH